MVKDRVEADAQTSKRTRRLSKIAIAGVLLVGIIAISRFDSPLEAQVKPAASLEQCANLGTTCDATHASQWQTGNLGVNNSAYQEGQSVPYRAIFTGLVSGATYMTTIEWDTTENGRHSLDYPTSFDRSEVTADPCSGLTCVGATNTLAIPIDPSVTAASVTQLSGQEFKIRGASFPGNNSSVINSGNLCATGTCLIAQNPSAYTHIGTYAGNSSTSVNVFFTATASTAVLSWGGHIATRSDWGPNSSASVISGSSYHMRLNEFLCASASNCGVGSMDRSMSSAAVTLPGSITIMKQAATEGNTSFSFTASPTPLSNFSLVDDGTVANTRAFTGLTNFTTYTITEDSKSLWGFDRASCSVTHDNGGTQNIVGRTISIVLAEGEDVLCTYYNSLLPVPGLSITKTADVATYSQVGDVVTYTYDVRNTGETVLGPDQFMVDDDHINGGTPFACGPANTTLQVNQSVTCTAQYSIVSADVSAPSVVNAAFATGGGLTTSTVNATVTYVAPQTTTTTSTTSTTTSTTTTTLPGETTTTTIAPTTTTIAPTTTTTLVAVTTTTTPTDQQVIIPTNPDDGLDVLLPETGVRSVGISLIVLVLLLLGGLMVSLGNTRKSRQRKIGGK